MSILEITQQYIKFRKDGETQKAVDLCDEQIVLQSEKDGKFVGKTAVKAYFDKNLAQGTWEAPKMYNRDRCYVSGVVRYMFIDWDVYAIFSFTSDHKISKINVVRGKIDD